MTKSLDRGTVLSELPHEDLLIVADRFLVLAEWIANGGVIVVKRHRLDKGKPIDNVSEFEIATDVMRGLRDEWRANPDPRGVQ